MEALTRLVAESLARHGLDRPVDYRRLHWSQWFRCESPHSLLSVPSKPGVFALAEEVMSFDSNSDAAKGNCAAVSGSPHLGADALVRPAEQSSAVAFAATTLRGSTASEGRARRMLAVLQFCEDDDMAFVLDRMLSRQNPMRARLASGRCFVRYVVIEDAAQRRSITGALNQWLISSSETASGIGAHFATSLELSSDSNVARTCPEPQPEGAPSATAGSANVSMRASSPVQTPASHLDSGASTNIHCPSPLPSGF